MATDYFIYLVVVFMPINSERTPSMKELEPANERRDFFKSDMPFIIGVDPAMPKTNVLPDRTNAKRALCRSDTIFWFYNTVAYEEIETTKRHHSIEIENCVIKANESVTLTLYQIMSKPFPHDFWTERVVLGFAGRTHATYWIIHKLYVFAVFQNGSQIELSAHSGELMKEIPYGYGYVNFSAATQYSDTGGDDSFGINGSVQMDHADKAVLRQGTTSMTTKERSKLKARSRRAGSATTAAEEEDTSVKDLMYVAICVGAILAILLLIRCCHLMLILFSKPARPYHSLPVSLKRTHHH